MRSRPKKGESTLEFLRYKHVVVQAATIELAIQSACSELNVLPKQLEVKVLEKPRKGLFGLFRQDAKVQATCLRSPEEKAELFLHGCMEKMGLRTQIELRPGVNSHSKIVNLSGEHLGVLIGKRGRTIESIQYLVNLVANQDAEKPIRFIVDADGYRQRREESVTQLALRTAAKVRRFGRPVKLEPMPAMERKVVHTVLQDEPDLETYSEGIEPHRSIVIKRTGK